MVRNKPMPTSDRSMRPRLLTKIAKRVIRCKFTKNGKKKSHAVLSKHSQNKKSDHIKLQLWKNKTKWMVQNKINSNNNPNNYKMFGSKTSPCFGNKI